MRSKIDFERRQWSTGVRVLSQVLAGLDMAKPLYARGEKQLPRFRAIWNVEED